MFSFDVPAQTAMTVAIQRNVPYDCRRPQGGHPDDDAGSWVSKKAGGNYLHAEPRYCLAIAIRISSLIGVEYLLILDAMLCRCGAGPRGTLSGQVGGQSAARLLTEGRHCTQPLHGVSTIDPLDRCRPCVCVQEVSVTSVLETVSILSSRNTHCMSMRTRLTSANPLKVERLAV